MRSNMAEVKLGAAIRLQSKFLLAALHATTQSTSQSEKTCDIHGILIQQNGFLTLDGFAASILRCFHIFRCDFFFFGAQLIARSDWTVASVSGLFLSLPD